MKIKQSIDYVKSLEIWDVTEGESIEEKVERITTTNQPISDGAPIIHVERSKGVEPQYDVRTDRWDLAINATTKIEKAMRAKRDEYLNKNNNNINTQDENMVESNN